MNARTGCRRLLWLAGLAAVPLALAAPPSSLFAPTPEALAAIRANYDQVTALVTQGQLLQLKRDFGCANVPDAQRAIWRDPQGVARKYAFSGSTGDWTSTVSQFYGTDGRLSFALVTSGAVDGTQIESRLYYGPAGNVLRQIDRVVHGPGTRVPAFWQWVVTAPDVAFAAPSPCP